MRSLSYVKTVANNRLSRLVGVVLLVLAGLLYFASASGLELPLRSLLLSDNRPSVTATYQLSFSIPAVETLGSIELQICASDPLQADPCTLPGGFNISSATLSVQSGETGFTILLSGTTANTIVLTRPAQAAASGPVSYTFSGVINPNLSGTYFGRIQTFASTNASGSNTDFGGLAFGINTAIQITSTVPPYLLFCMGVTISGFDCSTTSGNYINFGNINSSTTASATSDMLTATNAANGYGLQVFGQTMTSGNNTIAAMGVPDVSRPGIAQFGLNLVGNQTPAIGSDPQGGGAAAPTVGYNTANFYKFHSGDTIASVSTSDAYRFFTTSYIVNMPVGQAPGVYVATLTYVCLANF